MDKNVLKYLDSLHIKYEIFEHEAVFTVAEAEKVDRHIPALHSKNLFLKGKDGSFYLVCLRAKKRLDIKNISEQLGVKKLSFASPDELKRELRLTPGSVSVFGLIYAKNVQLVLDKDLLKSDRVGFHPNINTATLVIDQKAFEKFLQSLENIKIQVLDI